MFLFQDVKFPLSLDVFELCSEDLQQKLIPAREKFKEQEDKLAEEASKVRIAVRKFNPYPAVKVDNTRCSWN